MSDALPSSSDIPPLPSLPPITAVDIGRLPLLACQNLLLELTTSIPVTIPLISTYLEKYPVSSVFAGIVKRTTKLFNTLNQKLMGSDDYERLGDASADLETALSRAAEEITAEQRKVDSAATRQIAALAICELAELIISETYDQFKENLFDSGSPELLSEAVEGLLETMMVNKEDIGQFKKRLRDLDLDYAQADCQEFGDLLGKIEEKEEDERQEEEDRLEEEQSRLEEEEEARLEEEERLEDERLRLEEEEEERREQEEAEAEDPSDEQLSSDDEGESSGPESESAVAIEAEEGPSAEDEQEGVRGEGRGSKEKDVGAKRKGEEDATEMSKRSRQ